MTLDPAAAAPDSDRRAARLLQDVLTCSCRGSAAPTRSTRDWVHPRRHRPVLRQARRQRDLLADQPAAVRAERQRRERQPRESARRGRGSAPRCSGNISALDPNLDDSAPAAVQPRRAARAAEGALRRDHLRRQQGTQPDLAAEHQHSRRSRRSWRTSSCRAAERANTNFLRPYQGYSNITQRRSDAFSDYNSLQFYLNKRRGDIKYSVSYTLGKVDGSRQRQRRQPAGGRRLAADRRRRTSTTSSGRRRSTAVTRWSSFRPTRRRSGASGATSSGQILGGWEISGKIRWQSGQYLTADGQHADRRAAAPTTSGGEIDLDDRDETRWFNTDAFVAAPVDRRGNATVGMIQGPHWRQADVSLRKRFRFSRPGTSSCGRRCSTCSTR